MRHTSVTLTLILLAALARSYVVVLSEVSPNPGKIFVPNEQVVGKVQFPDPKLFFAADGTPDYRAFYRERYEYMAEHFFAPENDEEIRKLKDNKFGVAVIALLWLSQSDDGEKYLQRGHDLFGILLDYADGNSSMSCDPFGAYPVLKAALMLKSAGRFDAEWEPALKRFTQSGVSPLDQRFPQSDGNLDLARMYTCLLAKKLYPEMPEAVSAAAKVNNAFTRIIKQGDLYTDSLNYFGVSFYFFIQIAHELGREDEIAKSPEFKRMFANIRDAVSPNGYLPEFGHGYFSPAGYANTPVFLEYAGALYHDSSFSVAARRNFDLLIQAGPVRDTSVRNAIHSCGRVMPMLMDYFEPWGGPGSSPEFISGVTYRNARIGGEKPAFVILRPAVTPGSPMVLMDVLGQGDHCQPEFTASIAYYESDHVPLFYQYGRYISGASRGNQIFFGEIGAQQPDPEWPPNTWRTFSIPSDRLTTPDGTAVVELVSLRTGDRNKNKEHGIILDNLRLSGPDGTRKVCDLGGEWRGNGTISTVEGRISGERAVNILADGNGCYLTGFSPLSFNPDKYMELLCDVKWTGKIQPRGQFRPTQDYSAWMFIENTSLLAVLKNVAVERQGEDCRARLVYSTYGTFDSSLVRQIVLTKEGVLAVRDDILPGESADGRPAFTLWQMYSIDSEAPGRFSSFGECAFPSRVPGDTNRYRRGMSVYFSGPEGAEFGKQVIPGGRGRNYRDLQRDRDLRTAYASLLMHAGKAAYLNLLVVPHMPEENLIELDSATSYVHDGDYSAFRTVCDGVPVSIEIKRTGEWQVSRP